MRTRPLIALALLSPTMPGFLGAAEPDPKGVAFFESKIRPVLVEHCYSCHSSDTTGGKKLKAGLAIDTREGLLVGGESGPAIVPGKPEKSLLIQSLRHTADAPEMPPTGKLPAAVLADFDTWVRQGAPDPRVGKPGVRKLTGMSLEDGRKFWSLVPPTKPTLPAVKDAKWPSSDVDRFVQADREAKGLPPVGDADRRSLARRVTFDLTGLPPDPADVDAFVADKSPDAYANLVDRLLKSPQFGERWGRHWLDVARYADSNGRDRNILWYHAWRYRDYVIDSFNRDVPFDRFVREQIAGDLLPAETPAERDRLRTATGFLALGPKLLEESKPEVYWMDLIDEQIEVIGRSVLGLSVGCARCHDHKFDPIPTKDYYAIAGILRSTEPLYGYGPPAIKATAFHNTDLQAVGAGADTLGPQGIAFRAKLQDLRLKRGALRGDQYRLQRKLTEIKLGEGKPGIDQEKLKAEVAKLDAGIKEFGEKLKAADLAIQEVEDNPPPMPGWAMAARDRATPVDCRVHIRGETAILGEVAPRGVLRVFPNAARPMPATRSGRRELADWLADPGNPLTARVYVNRVWQHLFGRGLVTTPDDFGVNGTRPTHPGLLDFLAIRFVENGWSTKSLVRELVLSRTYRLASDAHPENLTADPENVYLWRATPRGVGAEAFRDAVLRIAGQLDTNRPPTTLFQKLHEYRQTEYFSFNPPFGQELYDCRYRSVYLPVVRGVLPEIFQQFDFASPDRPVAKRDETTVPSQALFLMNNPWVIAQARHAARRLLADATIDDAGRVDRIYRAAYSRPPRDEESSRAVRYLAEPESITPDPKSKITPTREQLREERWTSFCQAIVASAEFRTLR